MADSYDSPDLGGITATAAAAAATADRQRAYGLTSASYLGYYSFVAVRRVDWRRFTMPDSRTAASDLLSLALQ